MNQANSESAQLLLRETNVMISLPEICVRLREVLADPGHSRKDISEVMRYDPAMTARLLRIVNSAYYSLPQRVNSISQALGILGEQELNNLVLVTSIVRMSQDISPRMDIHGFWKHSVFTAVLARNLCPPDQPGTREEYFLAGLLLNIGKLLLYAKEPDLENAVEREMALSGSGEIETERKLAGTDHACVGALLASNWSFSASLTGLIASHHEDAAADTNAHAHCAVTLAHYLGDHYQELGKGEKRDSRILERHTADTAPLGLDNEALLEVIESTHNEYLDVYEVFCGETH